LADWGSTVRQPPGATDPGTVALALEAGGVLVVLDDFAEEGLGGGGLALGEEEFGVLDAGAGVAVVGGDPGPGGEGSGQVAKGGQGLGEGGLCVAVVVFGIEGEGGFEEGTCLGGTVQSEQAMSEVGHGIGIVGIALEGVAVADLGVLEPALGEEDVGEVELIAGVVEMIDPVLDFLEPRALSGAGEFESGQAPAGGALDAIDLKEIQDGGQDGEDEDADGPDPIAASDGVDQHPDGEREAGEGERTSDEEAGIEEVLKDGPERHGREVRELGRASQSRRFGSARVGRPVGCPVGSIVQSHGHIV